MGNSTDQAGYAIAQERDPSTVTIIAIASIFIATAIVLMIFGPAEDVLNFYDQAMCLKDGLLPYADFNFEFPPMALLFFAIPGLFTSDLVTYSRLFALQCAVFQAAAIWCVSRMVPDRFGSKRNLVTIAFALMMLVYISESVKKFDGIVMSLTVISLYFFMKGRWGPAYAIIAVAAFTKMYPCFLLVLMMAYNIITSEGGIKAVRMGIIAMSVVAAVSFVPLWIAGVPLADSLSFIGYHTGRGFQVESTVATIVQIMAFMGITEATIVPSNYTHDVIGPITDALSPYWVAVCLIAVALASVFCIRAMLRDRGGFDTVKLSAMAMLVCTTFVLTNKVFSTQYMMWIFPFVALMCCACRFDTPRMRATALLVVFLLVQLVCMSIIGLDIGSGLFVLSCATRDIILVLLLIEAIDIIRRPSEDPGETAGIVGRGLHGPSDCRCNVRQW